VSQSINALSPGLLLPCPLASGMFCPQTHFE